MGSTKLLLTITSSTPCQHQQCDFPRTYEMFYERGKMPERSCSWRRYRLQAPEELPIRGEWSAERLCMAFAEFAVVPVGFLHGIYIVQTISRYLTALQILSSASHGEIRCRLARTLHDSAVGLVYTTSGVERFAHILLPAFKLKQFGVKPAGRR